MAIKLFLDYAPFFKGTSYATRTGLISIYLASKWKIVSLFVFEIWGGCAADDMNEMYRWQSSIFQIFHDNSMKLLLSNGICKFCSHSIFLLLEVWLPDFKDDEKTIQRNIALHNVIYMYNVF